MLAGQYRVPIFMDRMANKPRLLRLLGILLIAAAVLLAFYTSILYLGWQSGESLREERIQQTRSAELATQLDRAQEDMQQENYVLALRRLEWVLDQDPGDSQAQTLLEEAETALAETRTRPGAGAATATPAATRTTVEGEGNEEAEAGLRQAEQLVEAEEWQAAIRALIDFQHEFPGYERQHTDTLLYEAYVARGIDLLYGDQVELGLYYLAQAQELGDLSQDVVDQRRWAELYLAGMGYYDVNWDVALFYFRDLCLAAPFFQDSCQKLYEALVAYGDQHAAQEDWCPAESLYAEAYRIDDPSSLQQKLGQAREGCASATPTATAPISGTRPVTGTSPFTATFPAGPGFGRP